MIYEDDKKEERPPHENYREYRKQLEEKPASNETLILFVSAFFVMLLLFLGIVKQLSPDIDVSIGSSETSQQIEEIEKGSVDSRLKTLQMEDNSYGSDDSTFSPELEEKVRLPQPKVKVIGEDSSPFDKLVVDVEKKNVKSDEKSKTVEKNSQVPNVVPVPNVVAPVPSINPTAGFNSAKVIVGYYTTSEQAEVAKGIILDSGLNVQPFIKNIGGAYTLQVGSFSSREKAQSVANDLLKNNFPARVIFE